jgi:hypothetical protein
MLQRDLDDSLFHITERVLEQRQHDLKNQQPTIPTFGRM